MSQRIRYVAAGLFAFVGGGCAAPAAPRGAAPTVVTSPGGASADHTEPGLSQARAMAVGQTLTIDVTCERGPMYVGPFTFDRDGQSVEFRSTHAEVPQTCVGGSVVDSSGAFVSVAGFGCSDSGVRAEATNTYEYSPGNGGNGATPVYLQLAFTGDPTPPASCPPSRITLTRVR